jgi:hypothetical protein
MFKNRSFSTLVGLTIAGLAVLSIGTLAFTQQTSSIVENNRSSPLDWYFSHDHAIVDGDNNAVPVRMTNASTEQDVRMVMQELERERLDQLNANPFAIPSGGTRAKYESTIFCPEPSPSCD